MKRFLVGLLAHLPHGRVSKMYQWASLSLLVIVHYVVVAHQFLLNAYKRLLPRFTCKARRGIRPVAPKCIALALNDTELAAVDLERLESVLEWSVRLAFVS